MREEIRERRAADLPALVAVLSEQQSASRYPMRWPLPFPAEDFIVRTHELATWSATWDGEPVGHVSVRSVEGAGVTSELDRELMPAWAAGHGRPVTELATLSVLFTATRTRGSGLGGRLHDAAVAWMREHDLGPCLDVVVGTGPAAAMYRARGWVTVGGARPSWLPDELPPVEGMILPAAPAVGGHRGLRPGR